MPESFSVEPLAYVVGGRAEPTDDYWGGVRSIIRIDGTRFGTDAVAGLEDFSHLEIVFRFHLTDPTDSKSSSGSTSPIRQTSTSAHVAPETTPTGQPLAYSDTATCADLTGSACRGADSSK